MRYAKNIGGHPPHALLDAPADILQVWLVFHRRESTPADPVDLLSGLLLHFGEAHHRLDKSHQSSRGRVGPCLQEGAADITSQLIGESVGILGLEEVDAKARLDCIGVKGASRAEFIVLGWESYLCSTILHRLLDIQPVTDIKLLLLLVQLLRVFAQWQHEIRQPFQDGIKV